MEGRDVIDKRGEEAIVGNGRDGGYRIREKGWDRSEKGRGRETREGGRKRKDSPAFPHSVHHPHAPTHQALKAEQTLARPRFPGEIHLQKKHEEKKRERGGERKRKATEKS